MADLYVGDLERALFDAFPAEDAEPWDRPGLCVGDTDAPVTGVAVNLDMTAEAVISAHEAGCNVLVTHHPPFIKEGPARFTPQWQGTASGPGRMVYEAASRGVSVIAMHTNADRAVRTREVIAQMLGMECVGHFESLMSPARAQVPTGFGALLACEPVIPLHQLAQQCLDTFGGGPRVWGDANANLRRVAFLNGSWGEQEVYDICIARGIDCIIVGESRYHFCVDAQPHLAVIDLGHDRSELPIEQVLAEAVAAAGVPAAQIKRLTCSANNWWTPVTGR